MVIVRRGGNVDEVFSRYCQQLDIRVTRDRSCTTCTVHQCQLLDTTNHLPSYLLSHTDYIVDIFTDAARQKFCLQFLIHGTFSGVARGQKGQIASGDNQEGRQKWG